MRAVVSQVTPARRDRRRPRRDRGPRRRTRCSRSLDAYRAGVLIQGIAIKQADPPAAVNDAFKEVTAAQQEAQTYINQANAYALQLTAEGAGRGDRVRQGL